MNPPVNRAARPVDSSFKIFAGLVFLIPAVAVAVWAYWCFNGTAYYSDTERGNLEGAICSAVSLLFLVNALRLFVGAFSARGIKPQYEPLERRAILMPTRRVEVKFKRFYDVLFALVAVFFFGMSLLFFYQTFDSQFKSSSGAIIKGVLFPAAMLLILLGIVFLQLRAKRRAVRLFDASGITRGDGQRFSWDQFRGVVTRLDFNFQTQRRYVWRVELAFAGGEAAWIIPNRIKNQEEVFAYLAALPRAVPQN